MNGRFFGACFSIFRHKNGAAAPVDYSSTFATPPFGTSHINSFSQLYYQFALKNRLTIIMIPASYNVNIVIINPVNESIFIINPSTPKST